jgi:Asp-tRNA(Asn)/Glu-tRNA(Gln) amidotransferase A subunit family amidase
MPSRASELRQRAGAKAQSIRNKQHRCLEQSAGPAPAAAITTPEKEAAIALGSSASDLVQAILNRKLTATEVASVFIRRARVLGRSVNAVTDELYDAALARAREIDASLLEKEKAGAFPSAADADAAAAAPSLLLLGLPISVKDHIDVAGTDSTTGAAAKCFRPRAKDALVVELLKVAIELVGGD